MLALQGIKVLELSSWIFGPACGAILGEWGADVTKIENPEGGDATRGILATGLRSVQEYNYIFELCNRNKRGIAVNLDIEKGREILHKLVEKSDVFVTNLLPGIARKLASDYETVSGINPKIIYAQASGYGPEGPDKYKPGFDEVAFWARSGIMSLMGEPDSPPVPLRGAMGDLTGAAFLAGAIALALLARERFGLGQRVDVSLLASGLWVGGYDVQAALSTGQDSERRSRRTIGNPLYNTYQTKDSKWLFFAMLQTDRYWRDVCKALGREDLENDARFDSHVKRCQNSAVLISILDEVLATKTRAEWATVFNQHKMVWDPEPLLSEVLSDPQVLANKYIAELNHPTYGKLKLVGTPFQFDKMPTQPRRHAPQLGEHTEEILLEIGYDWDEILRLKDSSAIP